MISLDDAGEVYEMFRSAFPVSFLFFIPILIIISPASPVGAAQEFSVYRMQQFDLHGTQYGCRNAIVNLDARPLDAKTVTRRCIFTRFKDLSVSRFRDLISNGAGALLVLLPPKDTKLLPEEVEHFRELEQGMMSEETNMPVYFTYETDQLSEIYTDVQNGVNSDQAASAVEALFGSATANGFQMVINAGQSKQMPDFKVANIQGQLSGFGIEEQLPTIAIVAHYDAFAASPSLAAGADSNGSGVVAILEIARLFKKLYTNSRTHAKYNFLFLLSGAGKFNYQGTKRWIEDNLDSMETSLLSDVSFVLCLDSIGAGDTLYFHVSKPPKDDSPGAKFYNQMKSIIEMFHPEMSLEMVHKKINLANDYLAWEHERFSVRRLPAYTLSRLPTHTNLSRVSMTDTRSSVDSVKLTRNIGIIAEALARHIYNLQDTHSVQIFNDKLKVEESVVSSWLDQLTSQSRAAQVLDNNHPLVQTLYEAMQRYFLNSAKKLTLKAEKRDPEFMFYDGHTYTMNAYNVKPAVLDLFLALMIGGYLSLFYLLVQVSCHKNFVLVQSFLGSLGAGPSKTKTH